MNIEDKKILIGVPCGSGFMPTLMVQSLLQLHKIKNCAFLTVDRQRIDKARNYFVKQAIEGDFDYLLMIDDDNPIPPETLLTLLRNDKDVIVPPILSRNPNAEGKHTMCAFYKEDRVVKEKTIPYYNPVEDFREEGVLHEVDAVGCGCILIKREVFLAVAKEYEYPFEFGDITVEGQRRVMSEDCEFSERVTKLGFKLWLDESVVPIHLGAQQIIKYGMENTHK